VQADYYTFSEWGSSTAHTTDKWRPKFFLPQRQHR
jgi:hypothetical protein